MNKDHSRDHSRGTSGHRRPSCPAGHVLIALHHPLHLRAQFPRSPGHPVTRSPSLLPAVLSYSLGGTPQWSLSTPKNLRNSPARPLIRYRAPSAYLGDGPPVPVPSEPRMMRYCCVINFPMDRWQLGTFRSVGMICPSSERGGGGG